MYTESFNSRSLRPSCADFPMSGWNFFFKSLSSLERTMPWKAARVFCIPSTRLSMVWSAVVALRASSEKRSEARNSRHRSHPASTYGRAEVAKLEALEDVLLARVRLRGR